MTDTTERLIRDFIRYGRILFEQGLNNSHSGNMSARVGEQILVTRSGARLGDLSPEDIRQVNLHDEEKDKGASVETKVHRAVYLACPEVNAIVHAHNPYAIVLSLSHDAIIPVDEEGVYYLPRIPVLSCAKTIASDEVAAGLPPLIRDCKAAVVRGHGAFGGGKSIEEAAQRVSVVESASKLLFLRKQYESFSK